MLFRYDFLRVFLRVAGIRNVCPGSGFYPSRIPVATTAIKEGEKICFPTFFCSHKYQKMANYFIFEQD
jgi:hypothetical protein